MKREDDIWDQIVTLTFARVPQGKIDLPPLADQGGSTGPLRHVLREFLAASPETRSRYRSRMDKGQAFNEPDISELLSRPDCPIH